MNSIGVYWNAWNCYTEIGGNGNQKTIGDWCLSGRASRTLDRESSVRFSVGKFVHTSVPMSPNSII